MQKLGGLWQWIWETPKCQLSNRSMANYPPTSSIATLPHRRLVSIVVISQKADLRCPERAMVTELFDLAPF